MKVQAINYSPNFGARIKINKDINYDALFGTTLSGMGTASSALGSLPMANIVDPAHHIHTAAKIVDASTAVSGAGLIGSGGFASRYSLSFFKAALKNLKNKNIPS